MRRLITLIVIVCASAYSAGLCAEPVPPPRPPEDISADILKCDPNTCRISERLIGSLAGLPGSLVDLTSGDGQRLVRQADNFRKPGTHLQPSGEAKVMYHAWLDQTQAKGASILGFLKTNMQRNDRLEVRSTMMPGVAVLPEDLDYAKIAAAFKGKPQEEIDKYGIEMGVVVYEISAALYNTTGRKIDIDWPCYSLAGGKELLYKSGQETSECLVMAVYAPIPFCIELQNLSETPPGQTPPDKTKPGDISIASSIPYKTTGFDFSKITQNGQMIDLLLSAYVASHQPTVALADPPRAMLVPDVL